MVKLSKKHFSFLLFGYLLSQDDKDSKKRKENAPPTFENEFEKNLAIVRVQEKLSAPSVIRGEITQDELDLLRGTEPKESPLMVAPSVIRGDIEQDELDLFRGTQEPAAPPVLTPPSVISGGITQDELDLLRGTSGTPAPTAAPKPPRRGGFRG